MHVAAAVEHSVCWTRCLQCQVLNYVRVVNSKLLLSHARDDWCAAAGLLELTCIDAHRLQQAAGGQAG
jgi:hypothetical protein